MKRNIIITGTIIVLILTAFISNTFSQVANKCSIRVEIYNLKSDKGHVNSGLWNKKTFWMKNNKVFQGRIVKISNKKTYVRFKNLPCGEYAIAVYHDENSNKKLDTNFLGIPREGVGFSNNAKMTTGPAKYDKAKFRVITGEKKISIRMHYIFK